VTRTEPIFTGGDHLGVVTRDLDAAVRIWADHYGVGPWQVFSYDETSMTATYCATTGATTGAVPMLAALCSLNDAFRLELIQPLSDDGPYHDSLVAHGDADHLHHIRLGAAEAAAAQAALLGRGNDIVFDAAFAGADATGPRLRARYFDTVRELGFLLEVADRPASFEMPEPYRVYPPVNRAR
jgi:methylmalonyl-CoA/ethylmalonyl-CoA epimerase